jgi:hypothetical protein
MVLATIVKGFLRELVPLSLNGVTICRYFILVLNLQVSERGNLLGEIRNLSVLQIKDLEIFPLEREQLR